MAAALKKNLICIVT